jgi:DNA-binding MarR family transcriptional regulator
LSKQSERLLQDELGIGYSQFRILMVLEWNPRVSQRSIAASLGQTEASVSRQIRVLQRDGLLTSKADPENRRRHITTPTPKGMQLTESANAILRRHFGSELGVLDEEQFTQLMQNLQKLHTAVCRRGRAGACDHPLGL